jgi:plasmid stabilization system protein ParE
MLPVVWIPEANEDLLDARAWYDNIRPQLGERFALTVEATVEAIAEHPLQFPVVHRGRRRAGSATVSVRNLLRSSGASDRSNSLLPRQAESEALAVAVNV